MVRHGVGPYSVAMICAGQNHINAGAPAGQFVGYVGLDSKKVVPSVMAATDATLIGNDNDGYPAPIARGDEFGGAINQLAVFNTVQEADFLDQHAIAIEKYRWTLLACWQRKRLAPQADAVEEVLLHEPDRDLREPMVLAA